MVRRIATVLLASNAAVHTLAFVLFLGLRADTVSDYGWMVFYCSIALGAVGVAFINGPSASGGYDGQITAMHSSSDFASHDHADRESAFSVGLVMFVAAIISGCTGYLLTRL